jgi:methyltransferase (TIGR00027 family)
VENNQVSQLSLTSAFCRAYHSNHDNPKIFNDYLAPSFFTKEEYEFRIQRLIQGMQTLYPERVTTFPNQDAALEWFIQIFSATSMIVSRSRYTEDNLGQAVKRGVRQYVILGAGMDTFAYRRTDVEDQVQVFEIDHLATQAYKRRRIAELGWKDSSNLHFIPVDFTKDNLESALSQCSSYNPKALTFFSWLGVIYYLPYDAAFATLRTISHIAPVGSSIVFDYFDTAARDNQSTKAQIGRQIGKQAGEQLQTFLDPSTLASDIAGLGLRLHENLSPSEIERRYFQGRTDHYHAAKNTHFAWAMIE